MRGKTTAAAVLVAAAGIAGAASAASAATPAVPTATPVHFAPGATSAHVSGRVAANGDRRYTFSARAGQTATFHLSRSTSAMTWTLVGPTGPSVHNARSPRQSDFTYRLPTTGTYYVDIVSTRAATYDLSVAIPAARTSTGTPAGTTSEATSATMTTAGEKIRFAPGATSATITGGVGTTETARFRFDATAGQRATISLQGISPDRRWSLVAPDGTPLHTAMSEQQDRVTVVLPQTGGYALKVQSASGSTYALTLSIPRH
jgi:hypothetical protein